MRVMAKRKSFKESNPAAAFISTPEVKEEEKGYTDVDKDKYKDTKLDKDSITDKNTDTNKGKIIKKTPPRKIIQSQKTDIDKEADKEIYNDLAITTNSDSDVATQDCQVTTKVVPPKIIYRPKELKSKKVMILTKPSTHKALQKIASKRYTSVNDIINTLLEDFIASES
jgi:hypothetical protein